MRPVWAVKAIIVIVLASTLIRCVCGANHTVGDASGWELNVNMQDWSSTTTFNVGDDLVFIYTPVYDVVEVNKQGYDTCTLANAIATYNTGESVVHLTDNRTRYFVCGRMRMAHCLQGLKLEVQIQAQPNNNNNTNTNNGTNDDNQNKPSNGAKTPSPQPHNPPPTHLSPPPSPPDEPAEKPSENPSEKPSSADPLMTRVIILVLLAFQIVMAGYLGLFPDFVFFCMLLFLLDDL